MDNSLLKEGILPYHRTAAITACIIIIDMAIPLTGANRLAAMRDSDERITSIFTPFLRGPLRFTYALVRVIHNLIGGIMMLYCMAIDCHGNCKLF